MSCMFMAIEYLLKLDWTNPILGGSSMKKFLCATAILAANLGWLHRSFRFQMWPWQVLVYPYEADGVLGDGVR